MDAFCLQLFELLTGDALFDPIFQTSELHITNEESHLIQMIELFGDMPHDLVHVGTYSSRWFTTEGNDFFVFCFFFISFDDSHNLIVIKKKHFFC